MRIPDQSAGFIRNQSSSVASARGIGPAQALRRAVSVGPIGGRGFGGALGIEPRSPECSECQWTCVEVSCGPGCRREECYDVCTSVPC
jgi:hypothetical protein